MSDYQMFEVQVSQVEPLTEQVKRFMLVATDGKPLPAFTGGSHVIVQMSDGDNEYSNAYSLLSSPHDTSCYQIAVRLEENSRGGSRFLHQQVKVGDRLTISTPNNLFALIPYQKASVYRGRYWYHPFPVTPGRVAIQRRRLAVTLLLAKSRKLRIS